MEDSVKSPFIIMREYLSPLQCERIVDEIDVPNPDVDTEGKPIQMARYHEPSEKRIHKVFSPLIEPLEDYYNFTYKGTTPVSFEIYPEGCTTAPICDNSNHVAGKWVRTKDIDFTCVLFLSDYNDKPPFDSEYEVYGGKLGMHNFDFSFNPERGTLVMYPSGPHFVNSVSPPKFGNAYMARFHLAGILPWMYDPKQWPGTWRQWLGEFA